MRGPNSEIVGTWSALGHRLACASGALAALLSLFNDAPVWVATLRGAVAWLALAALSRACRALIAVSTAGRP